jgi:hypothetical protein
MTTVTISDSGTATFTGNEGTRLDSGAPTANNGNALVLTTDRLVFGQVSNCPIKFSGLSNINGPVTVLSATLTLKGLLTTGTNSTQLDLHLILRNWVEGNGTGGSGATWNTYDGTNSWGTVGCENTTTDRSGIVSASANCTATSIQSIVFTSDKLASDVQSMINSPSTNYGWLIRQPTETTTEVQISSDNNGTTSNRPVLSITYIEGIVTLMGQCCT